MSEPPALATRRLEARSASQVAAALRAAVAALCAGEVVVFPTDTVYGVGCDLWQVAAIERLYWAKERPTRLAIPVLVSAPEHVGQVAASLPEAFEDLAARFWPGGLTLVVPRRPQVPDLLCAGGPTVAVRMPDHSLALALIEAMGGALAATSANLSGKPASVTADEALADLDGRVALVLDGGACPGGVASSVLDLSQDPPVLLRAGALDMATLRALVPDCRTAAEL
ncbi:MAG: L-threonylcarbamoyladenylate synthase [Chloroflexota bacterium]